MIRQWAAEAPIFVANVRRVAGGVALLFVASVFLWALARVLEADGQFDLMGAWVSHYTWAVRFLFALWVVLVVAQLLSYGPSWRALASVLAAWGVVLVVGVLGLVVFDLFRIVAIMAGASLEGMTVTAARAAGVLLDRAPLLPLFPSAALLIQGGVDGTAAMTTTEDGPIMGLFILNAALASAAVASLFVPGGKGLRVVFALFSAWVALMVFAARESALSGRDVALLHQLTAASMLVAVWFVYSWLRQHAMRVAGPAAPVPPSPLALCLLFLGALPVYADLYNRHLVLSRLNATPQASVRAADYREVTAERLNVRNAPNPEAPIVDRLAQGARVQAFETQGAWVRIAPQAWVAGRFLAPASGAPASRSVLLPASFDCGRAQTEVEHAICRSPPLADADGRLARAYGSRLSAMTGSARERFVESQRVWLSERDRAAHTRCRQAGAIDPMCVLDVYDERIAAIER